MNPLDVTDRWLRRADNALRPVLVGVLDRLLDLLATLANRVSRPQGHHRLGCIVTPAAPWDEEAAWHRAMDKALRWADPETPAPGMRTPGQAPDAAAHVSVPADDAAAPLPQPSRPPAGLGQHPTYAVRPDGIVIIGPDGHLTIATPARQAARCRDTMAMPADDEDIVRPWYRAWLAANPQAEVAA